jgi:hypothetical protein
MSATLCLEPLEGRALLSAAGLKPPHAAGAALVAHRPVTQIVTNPGAVQAIMKAILGGAGHEWVALLNSERGQVRAEPVGGTLELTARGGVVEEPPYLLGSYIGRVHDRVAPQAAGAVVLKKDQIELGAIMRGPFTNYDGTDYVVFGINRGAGSSLPSILPSEPWINADALVTLAIGPNGSTYSGTITNRITGATQAIDPRNIQVEASVVRVLLDPSQLPSQGLPLSSYQFAVWTETQLNPSIGELASIVPQNRMLPIGVETNVNPTMS